MPTYAEAKTAQTQTQIRDGLLASLAADGSVVGGLPISSPDRGLVEADAAQLALEQSTRAAVAQSASITDAVAAGDSWVDACATWFRVSDGAGGYGRIQATAAVWTVGLAVAATAAPVTIQPGAVIQIQAADGSHTVFQFSSLVAVALSSGSSYKASAQFTARTKGAAGNVAASDLQNGTIITAGVAGLSVDASVLPTQVTIARDRETSVALRDRCLASWGRLGAGWTRQAFDYLIPLLVPNVTQWLVRDDNPYGPGTVGVVIVGGSGDQTTLQAGLGASNVRPLGSGGVTVTLASDHALTVTATLGNDGSNGSLHTNAAAALSLLQSVFPIGGTLDPSLVTGLLRGDPVGTVAILLYDGTYKSVTINAVGFSSVTSVTLSGAAASPVVLAWNERLVITAALTP